MQARKNIFWVPSTVIIFILLLQIYSLNSPQHAYELWGLQGFGTGMDIHYYQQFLVKSQSEFETSIRSYSLIRFAPTLTLTLTKNIVITNLSNILIMGPVTLTQFGIYIYNSSNIIIQDIRILNSSIYGILIFHSQQVVVDHCTILDASRTDITKGKCIDLTEESANVTISYNVLGYTYPIQQLHKFKGLLIANFNSGPVDRVSIHHNLFYCNYQRSPQISTKGLFDMRQNIVFNYTQYGSRIRNGGFGNFVENLYIGGKKDPLVFQDVGPIYSVKNSWKFDCKQVRIIPNTQTHHQYGTPSITTIPFGTLLKKVGCLNRGRWQALVQIQLQKYI